MLEKLPPELLDKVLTGVGAKGCARASAASRSLHNAARTCASRCHSLPIYSSAANTGIQSMEQALNDAVDRALEGITGTSVDFALVFVSGWRSVKRSQVVEQIKRRLPQDAAVLGCVAEGVLGIDSSGQGLEVEQPPPKSRKSVKAVSVLLGRCAHSHVCAFASKTGSKDVKPGPDSFWRWVGAGLPADCSTTEPSAVWFLGIPMWEAANIPGYFPIMEIFILRQWQGRVPVAGGFCGLPGGCFMWPGAAQAAHLPPWTPKLMESSHVGLAFFPKRPTPVHLPAPLPGAASTSSHASAAPASTSAGASAANPAVCPAPHSAQEDRGSDAPAASAAAAGSAPHSAEQGQGSDAPAGSVAAAGSAPRSATEEGRALNVSTGSAAASGAPSAAALPAAHTTGSRNPAPAHVSTPATRASALAFVGFGSKPSGAKTFPVDELEEADHNVLSLRIGTACQQGFLQEVLALCTEQRIDATWYLLWPEEVCPSTASTEAVLASGAALVVMGDEVEDIKLLENDEEEKVVMGGVEERDAGHPLLSFASKGSRILLRLVYESPEACFRDLPEQLQVLQRACGGFTERERSHYEHAHLSAEAGGACSSSYAIAAFNCCARGSSIFINGGSEAQIVAQMTGGRVAFAGGKMNGEIGPGAHSWHGAVGHCLNPAALAACGADPPHQGTRQGPVNSIQHRLKLSRIERQSFTTVYAALS